jgi:sugar/nucleoside kinase (ribokinase family)
MNRNGILAAGNLIVDHVKVIDGWPCEGMLSNVLEEVRSTGGGPSNVLIDLAKLEVEIPLYAAGIVGMDPDGRYVTETLASYGIDISHILVTKDASTSFTDVMSGAASGRRTFFHYRGANSMLNQEHLRDLRTNARIFHLGYLLLLDGLDEADTEFGVVAARVLHEKQSEGYLISVDVVSESSERFQRVVTPCLEHIDYLILNEIEAGRSAGLVIRNADDSLDAGNLKLAANRFLDGGVRELVAIHFPEGSYAMTPSRQEFYQPSYVVPEGELKGSAGAGDAFCAGLLYGLHEGLDLSVALDLAHASARFNLTSPTCSDGAVALAELIRFIGSGPERTQVPAGLESMSDNR